MASGATEFLNLIEKNVHFDYDRGDTTLVRYPHTTGWRVLPFLVVSQLNYACSIELEGGKTVRIQPGQTVTMAPGLVHKLTKLKRGAGYSRWCHIQCEVFSGVSLFSLVEPPLLIKGSRSRRIGQLNEEMAELSTRERSVATLLKRQALGWELISMLLQSVAFRSDRLQLIQYATRLTPVLAYIEQNLARPISHELLAETAHLSPSRFHFLFRSALGTAPYEYVQKLRLKKAQELLIRTDRSIAEIGQEVGHPDPFHFSRTFRRNLGLSPANYRKQMSIRSF